MIKPSLSESGECTHVLPAHLGALRRHDLNSLVTLSAVLRTGNVSSAARLLGLTQPAVSRSLDRLRKQLNDPLVIRQGNGVVPTARARQLIPELEALLDHAKRVFVPEEFSPANIRRDLRVAMNEHLQQLLIPRLLERVAREAPGIRIFARPIHEAGDPERLKEGHIDMIVGMLPENDALRGQLLMTQRLLCVAHRSVARKLSAASPLSLQAFSLHPQIDVQPAGMGRISASLNALLKDGRGWRNVVCVLSSFDALLNTLESGLHIGVLPERAFNPAVHPELSVVRLGFDLPQYTVSAWWHNVAHRDPVNVWLRDQLAQVCSASELASHSTSLRARPRRSRSPV